MVRGDGELPLWLRGASDEFLDHLYAVKCSQRKRNLRKGREWSKMALDYLPELQQRLGLRSELARADHIEPDGVCWACMQTGTQWIPYNSVQHARAGPLCKATPPCKLSVYSPPLPSPPAPRPLEQSHASAFLAAGRS